MAKSPCTKDCKDRTATCHYDGSCQRFAEYDKERVKETMQDNYEPWYSAHRDSINRYRKSTKWGK